MKKPKILFWDIETTPNIVTAFDLDIKHGIHHQNIVQERTIICVSWKWLGESKIHTTAVVPSTRFDEKALLKAISDVLADADAIVAHFGDGFDSKFVNARLIYHNLRPIPNVVQIDTWKIARSKFLFNSNKLDYLAQFLGIGAKIRTNYDLWRDCMAGKPEALNKMMTYNKHDVRLLEKVYLRLAPFVKARFPSNENCGSCGMKGLIKKGQRMNVKGPTQDYQCKSCGHYTSRKLAQDKGDSK